MHIRSGMDQRGDPAQKPAMKCCQNQHRGEVTAAAVEFSGSLDRPLHRGRQFESNPQPPWCCFEGRCGLQFHIGSVRGSSCRGFLSFGFFWQVTWFALQDMDIWYVCMYIYNIIIYYICIIVYVCVYVVYVYIYIWLENSMQDFQETNPWAIWANSIRRSTARLRLTRMPQQAGHSEELAVYGAGVEVRIRTGCPWPWLAYSSGEIQIRSALHLVISSAI